MCSLRQLILPTLLVATICHSVAIAMPKKGRASSSPLPPTIRVALSAGAEGRKHEALALVEHWLRDHPGDVGAHVVRGDLLLDCLRAARATRDFRFALAANPGDRYALGRLLEALLFQRRYDEAVNLLERAALTAGRRDQVSRALVHLRARARKYRDLARRKRAFLAATIVLALAWLAGLTAGSVAIRRLSSN